MGAKGKKSKQLIWSDTNIKDKLPNSGWSLSASNDTDVLYIMYYDNNKKGVYLYDIKDDVTYQVPYGAKAQGYTLAFKLFSYR